VLRLGLAPNFGLGYDEILYAARSGVGYWLWNPNRRFQNLTKVLKEVLGADREKHVVAYLANVAYTGGMVRRGVEKALRTLGVDQLDLYLLPWMGKASRLSGGVVDALTRIKEEGKVLAVGTSIHDRVRAGRLARESALDALMVRYNAKHPGAERDIFPQLEIRQPLVVSYTATSWRQLLKPIPGLKMPPWPGFDESSIVPPPLTAKVCYRFCLSSPHIHVVMTGPANRQQLDENLGALEAGPLSYEEDAWVREYGRKVRARKKLPFM
jgi:aryl-alcohol dehydrogenase-like predicted oxidoreductase